MLLCFSQKLTNLNKFGAKKNNIYSNQFPNDALFIDTKRGIVSKFNHRKLGPSMSSTNNGKNCYRSISFVLMLEQNMLITITSWQRH